MRSTYIGLPAADVAKATAFLTALGFTLDPRASSDRTACVLINDSTAVMLHEATYFAEFTGAPVTDPARASEVSVGLSAESRAEVDELTERAVAAGGQDVGAQDLGYMYMRAFRDLDGHRWSFIHMAG
ncbi:VOC family protein [Pseudonocardia sp. GCM10023141]|uniref:VOC family protein n=1 Tax=Pseudonocardia sp. GCM10023141 TaxID=3252653 RepID=UPI00361D310C